MCLGGGGYMPQPVSKPKPVQKPGPESPPDMVNDQVIPNANDRAGQEAAQNMYDPLNKDKPTSQSNLQQNY